MFHHRVILTHSYNRKRTLLSYLKKVHQVNKPDWHFNYGLWITRDKSSRIYDLTLSERIASHVRVWLRHMYSGG